MSKSNQAVRHRVGRVSYYQHHGAWWVYYREKGKPLRRRIDGVESDAEREAARVNAVLCGAIKETPFAVPVTSAEAVPKPVATHTAIAVAELQKRFLAHHELVKRSSISTVKRYRAATSHLLDFAAGADALSINVHDFVLFLRQRLIAPNGHANTARRPLRDKGVRYILQVCRSMYRHAIRTGILTVGTGNPFDALDVDSLKIEDAKPIFVFDAGSELRFLNAADDWTFAIHFTLAKTGMRPGELVHLLIEDVDFEAGLLHIRSKPELGWQIKTRSDRSIPMIPAQQAMLRHVVGERRVGPLFLRRRFDNELPKLVCDRTAMVGELEGRITVSKATSRVEQQRVARSVWRDVGAVKVDEVRSSFLKTCAAIGLRQSTCPKSWRHTLATLLQDANVDPLVRQTILGHKPSVGSGPLGMTGIYTHTRPETLRESLARATELWPESLRMANERFVSPEGEVQ